MEGRYRKLLLSLLVLVLVVSIGKETYSLFTNEVSSVVQSYGTGTLKLSYSNTSINLDNAYPMADTDGMNQSDNTITITNTGTLAYKFDVILDPSSDSTISSSLIRVSIDGENPAALSTDSNIIIRDVILNPGSSRTFTIKLWINSNASSSDILNKKFSASLTSTGIAVKNAEDSDGTVLAGAVALPLFDQIKNNADTTTEIDFSQTSEATGTNGIYMTTETTNNVPVYYYRGNVSNNNVLLGDYCWKIVRTTETGGIKLLYNGEKNTTYSSYKKLTYSDNDDSDYVLGAYNNFEYDESSKLWKATNFDSSNNTYYIYFMPTITGSYSIYFNIQYTEDIGSVDNLVISLNNEEKFNLEFTADNKFTGYFDFGNLTADDEIEVELTYYGSSNNIIETVIVENIGGDNGGQCFNTGGYISSSSFNDDNIDSLGGVSYYYNGTNSTIKNVIDNWYVQRMDSQYGSYFEDTVFCNDRSVSDTNFGTYNRFGDASVTLSCPQVADSFSVSSSVGNGQLSYPVGLLTADEFVFAGMSGMYVETSSTYFDKELGWTMSPAFSGSLFGLGDTWSDIAATSSKIVRPVVSLKPGTNYIGGNGKPDKPYVIE